MDWPADIVRALHAAADAAGLERALVRAVAWIESRGNARAVSPAGAQGLMQLMPATAKGLGVKDSFDANQNANAGARYLAALVKQFGSVEAALWAYNWGPGNLQRAQAARKTIPGEVIAYAKNVFARAAAERALDPLPAPPAPPPPAESVSYFCCPDCGSRLAVSGAGVEHGA